MAKSSLERRPQVVAIPSPGGWNPDATESSMPKGEFIEARNYRKQQMDMWEVRTGIKEKSWDGLYPVGGAEYRLDDVFVRVLFYEEGNDLKAKIYDGARSPELEVTIGPITSVPPFGAPHFEVQSVQFNTFLLVTVYGVGVFVLFPTATDLSAWSFRELMKLQSPTPEPPSGLQFLDKATGDLIIYQYETPRPGGGADLNPTYAQSGSPEPMKIRFPMNAPYFLAAGSVNIQSTNLVKRFEAESVSSNASDGSAHLKVGTTQRAVGTKYHLQKRGWFVKFLVRSEYTDVRGQKISYYQAPSVDIFIPDMNYAPPYIANTTNLGTPLSGTWAPIKEGYSGPDSIDDTDIYFSKFYPDPAEIAMGGGALTLPDFGTTAAFSSDIYKDFIQKFRKYFHDILSDNVRTTGSSSNDPLYFTATLLGFIESKIIPGPDGRHRYHIYPYKISVPASELFNAPQTIFNWSDFHGLPADAVEIEVYRTAHTDSPQYAPNVYGLAGSVKPDASFTDTTADFNLDFNGRTESEVGFLEGESSGKVIRIFNNNIRLGDTVTNLIIRKPSKLVQAFAFDGGDLTPVLTKANLIGDGGDGLPPVAFGYQYVDNNGYVSEITSFPVDITGASDSAVGVAFTFPHGYNDTITNIYVFEGRMVLGKRVWRRARGADGALTVDPKDGHFLYPGYLGWGLMPEAVAASDIISKDRGACTWSEGSDMFLFPPENFELEHEFAPVTHIDNVAGPALIHTEQSTVQTTFGVDNRWEEVHDRTGCIARGAAIKIGKVEYFLAATGLHIAEGYSLRPFPGYVQSEVKKYLSEEILGVPRLTNARRASLGWLGDRHELWLHFPSSTDLGGTLPAATFVYRLFDDYGDYTSKYMQNYRFDLKPGLTDDGGVPTYFISSATGKLFALFFEVVHLDEEHEITKMVLLDCDAQDVPWASDAYLTLPLTLSRADIQKELEGVNLFYDRKCTMSISSGMRRTDGVEDDLVHGLLKDECEIIDCPQPADHYRQAFYHPIDGGANRVFENIADWTPLIRIHTEPDSDGDHFLQLQSLAVKLNEKEDNFVTRT